MRPTPIPTLDDECERCVRSVEAKDESPSSSFRVDVPTPARAAIVAGSWPTTHDRPVGEQLVVKALGCDSGISKSTVSA